MLQQMQQQDGPELEKRPPLPFPPPGPLFPKEDRVYHQHDYPFPLYPLFTSFQSSSSQCIH